MGTTLHPPEDDPPLVVDANAVKPAKIAPKGLEPVTRRGAKVEEASDGVEHIELAKSDCNDVGWEAANPPGLEPVVQVGGRPVAEGRDQRKKRLPITRLPCNRRAG